MTGLRGRQLALVLGVLAALAVLAVVCLAGNLLIFFYGGLGPPGRASGLRLRDGAGQPVVRFLGDQMKLGTVVARSGQVGGYRGQPLRADASRILVGSSDGAHLALEEGRIRAEAVQDLLVLQPHTRHRPHSSSSSL